MGQENGTQGLALPVRQVQLEGTLVGHTLTWRGGIGLDLMRQQRRLVEAIETSEAHDPSIYASIAEAMGRQVVAWDLTLEDGTPAPAGVEGMRLLLESDVSAVIGALNAVIKTLNTLPLVSSGA